jgi:hypothetical protein
MKLKDMQDMYWGHDDRNRFSLLGITQMYLAVSLDSISEATPWKLLLEQSGGINNQSLIPFDAKDYDAAREFSKQCYENSTADGIYYVSSKNPKGRNVYLYDRCKKKFNASSVIAREPLIDAIKPMKEILENRLGIEFLL